VPDTIKLTTTAKAAGCAAKLSPGLLERVLKNLPPQTDPNRIVGFETSDDAGVYRITNDIALVQTVDFFTPLVDDPYLFGQVAAANALSDVYAMGGRPITALSIVAFPPTAPLEILEQIMRGGLDKMREANCTVLGGHSIRDDEPKFGYAVTGLVHPDKIWRNFGARPGDVLLFTKPIGTGVIATALKQGQASEESVQAATDSMTRLNKDTAEALLEFVAANSNNGAHGGAQSTQAGTHSPAPLHAVTDVTGFGILGHAREMAIASGVSFRLDHTRFEYLSGAIEYARAGFLSGGLKNNREFVEGCAVFAPNVTEEFRHLFHDPQTSGGFLIALEESLAPSALSALKQRGIHAAIVGNVIPKRSPLIEVV
jgi:selenide, water dikinase